MNEQDILNWIQLHRPEWLTQVNPQTGQTYYQWLEWAIQNSPNKQQVLDSVSRDIQNGETDISKVNTNAEYNVQQASKPSNQPAATTGYPNALSGMSGGATGFAAVAPDNPPPVQKAPVSDGSWTSTQQMEDFIQKGGEQNLLSGVLGISRPSWVVPRQHLYTKALTDYVNNLPKNQQKTALSTIQQYLKDRSGWTPLRQTDLEDALGQAQRDVQSATAGQPPAPNASGQVIDPSSHQDIFQGAPTPYSTGSTDLNDEEKRQWSLYTGGQNYDQLLKGFQDNYAIAVQRVNASGVSIGEPQLWTGGALNLATGYVATPVPLSQLTDAEKKKYSDLKKLRVSGAQFAAMMSQGAYSKILATKAVEDQYTAQYGKPPPADLQKQIEQQIAGIDQFTFQTMIQQGGGSANAWAANAVKSGGLFGTLFASQPAAQEQMVQDQLLKTLGPNWSKYVTPAQVTQMAGMSSTDQTNYINNLPDPSHPGFTIGAWSSGYGQVLSQWQTEFGFSAKPTDAQISALMGMNATQRTDYFNNSPSPVKGMNNFTYKQYDNTINNLRSDLTPSMGADFMASLAHPSKTPVP